MAFRLAKPVSLAVELGLLGRLKGGKARVKKLCEIARKAARTRWEQ